jgi:hypothetical protein
MNIFQPQLTISSPIVRGTTGTNAKLVQEWLTLNGYSVSIDGNYGPATEAAVKKLQAASYIPPTGAVDSATFSILLGMMKYALRPIVPAGHTLGSLAVAYAQQHLSQHPREVGGENCGPWVRLYCDGKDGVKWAWCAGFATYCLMQAAQGLGRELPFTRSLGCTQLGVNAKMKGVLHVGQSSAVQPGWLFLVKKPDGSGYHHTGIVVSVSQDHLETLEGNSNNDGSREGNEVVAHHRSYNNLDFIEVK